MGRVQNAEEAIIQTVNDTHDNDTIAAIVGAAVGALHGEGALPAGGVRSCRGEPVRRMMGV